MLTAPKPRFTNRRSAAATIASRDLLRRAFAMIDLHQCRVGGVRHSGRIAHACRASPSLEGRVNVQLSDLYSGKNDAEAADRCDSVSILLPGAHLTKGLQPWLQRPVGVPFASQNFPYCS